MQAAKPSTEVVLSRFERLSSEMAGFVAAIADAVKKPFAQREEHVLVQLRARSGRLAREVMMLANTAAQEIAGQLRAGAAEGSVPLEQDPRVHRLREIQNSLLHWHSCFAPVMACLERQIAGAPQPLYEPEPEPDSVRRTIYDAMDRTMVGLDYALNPVAQDEHAEEMGCFPDIRLKYSEFVQHALAAYRVGLVRGLYRRASFLDVGCGGGGKLLMASQFFDRADGLEIDPGYAAAAAQLVWRTELPASTIHEANALTYDGYGEYDIVYFYQPMRNTEKLIQLERRIVDTVRPGAILVAPYLAFRSRALELGCGQVAGHVYLSATSPEQAEEVRREAEQTGVRVVHEVATGAWGGIWLPVLQAFAANGFALR